MQSLKYSSLEPGGEEMAHNRPQTLIKADVRDERRFMAVETMSAPPLRNDMTERGEDASRVKITGLRWSRETPCPPTAPPPTRACYAFLRFYRV
jgi:hypothetical protein